MFEPPSERASVRHCVGVCLRPMGLAVASGLEILKVLEQTWVRRLPTQRFLRVGNSFGSPEFSETSEEPFIRP